MKRIHAIRSFARFYNYYIFCFVSLQGLLYYQIKNVSLKWSQLFGNMENLKQSCPIIDDYTVTDTSLEEVFMSFAQQDEISVLWKKSCWLIFILKKYDSHCAFLVYLLIRSLDWSLNNMLPNSKRVSRIFLFYARDIYYDLFYNCSVGFMNPVICDFLMIHYDVITVRFIYYIFYTKVSFCFLFSFSCVF